MTNQPFEQKLSGLESRIQQLIQAYESQRKKTSDLALENSTLKEEVDGLKAKLSNFQNQDKIAKIVSSTTVEKDESVELKNKLNEYIKEIDRCIAHMG